MSLRVKTEDGDLIVSGKGKDGKDGKDGGGDIVWLYLDTSKQAIQIENINNCHFPVISSHIFESGYTYTVTGGVLVIYAGNDGWGRYIQVNGTVRNIASETVTPVSGQPTVFKFVSGAKWILGIPKPCIEEFGVSIVSI